MFIRKFAINGIKGINNTIDLDFSPSQSSNYDENIEKFDLERNKAHFAVLKQIGFIGLNSSGKTSILLAIAIGVGLLANSNDGHYLHFYSQNKNLFSREPLKCKMEIVLKGNQAKTYAQKYIIEYEYNQRQFVSEKVTYVSASKTMMTNQEVLYQFKDGVIYIGGKKTTINHNPLYSIFSLIHSGQINQTYFGNIVKEHLIFRQLKTYSHSIFDHLHQLITQPQMINLPTFANQRKLLLGLLRIFDRKIDSFYTQPDGRSFIVFKVNGHEEKIRLREAINYFSSGTLSMLTNYRAIMTAIFAKQIILFDEMGKSVHFGLFRTYFEIFRKTNAQLFFTTHFESIFKQFIRLDQLFNVQNVDGEITIKRLSDQKDIDPRYINAKKVAQALQDFPDTDQILEVLNLVDTSINENKS